MKKTILVAVVGGAVLALSVRTYQNLSAKGSGHDSGDPVGKVSSANGKTLHIRRTKNIANDRPGSPDYDAIKLGEMMDMGPGEIFDSEPRSEEWATEFEAVLSNFVQETLASPFPQGVEVKVDCRTACCQTSMTLTNTDNPEADAIEFEMLDEFAQTLMPIGPVFRPGSHTTEDSKTISVTSCVSRELTETDEYLSWVRQIRSRNAKYIGTFREDFAKYLRDKEG